MTQPQYIPFDAHQNLAEEDMIRRAFEFRQEMQTRRSVRQFSDRAVPIEIIEECLQTASSAPSGANLQPWHFVVISDSAVKRQIRLAAEQEEHEFYTRRAPPEWMAALAPLGTDEHKPFLEIAPYLIAIFALNNSQLEDGRTVKNYYVSESVGISTGMLITALHHAGLACLTHTPSPMKFLNRILNRPPNERPYLLLVVGYPAPEAVVPDINKKSLDQVATFV